MHAFLVTFGTDGDVFPYLGLSRELRRRGHRVTIVCSESYEGLASQAADSFHSLASISETEEVLSNPDMWHPLKGGVLMARWGARLIERQYDLLRSVVQGADAVLVANPGVVAARLVQETCGVPMASLVLQPGIIPSVFEAPFLPIGPRLPRWAPRFVGQTYWRLLDLFGDFLIGRELNRIRAALRLDRVRRLFRWWLSPDLVLGMFPEWYAAPQPDWPPQMRLIGFPLNDGRAQSALPSQAAEFLEAGSPPIVFTPGSEVRHASDFFEEAIEVCRELDHRALFLTKHTGHLPQNLPPHVAHFEYLPFDVVFPRCAAVVHHGGVGTVAKALAAGIPQLVRPFAWDQRDNAARVTRLGVGASVGHARFRRRRMAPLLARLLSAETRRHCREVAARFGADDPLVAAARQIEALRDDR